MLLLTGTADLLRLISSATADLRVHASWVDNNAGTISPGKTNTANITSATTTTIVASPGGSTQRNIKAVSIRNAHASTSCDVEVFLLDGTTSPNRTGSLIKCALLAGESLIFTQTGEWIHYDTNGQQYQSAFPAATQTEMEAGTATNKVVTPGNAHYHPSACKWWVKSTANSTTILASYNTTSITDTNVGIVDFVIGNDFSSANWCCVGQIENLDASIDAAADSQFTLIANAGQTAGGLKLLCSDATGSAAVEPAVWHCLGFGDL